MDRKRIFIVGGARSGKNKLAYKIAAESDLPVVYLATGVETDEEMADRIEIHQKERPDSWLTIEEPLDIEKSIVSVKETSLIIIDCLTFWLNNLFYMSGLETPAALSKLDSLLTAADLAPHSLIIISNDVGSGVVPEYQSARAYRDAIGMANQRVAAWADEVYETLAGLDRRWK